MPKIQMNRRRLRKLLISIIGLTIACGIGIFAYQQSQALVRGPILQISSPKDGTTYTKQLITVRGTATHISQLSLNGRQIFTNPDGVFTEQLLLAPGYNTITLTARDRFGRTRTKHRELVYTK